jgi:Cytochrome C oxidase, cbb3-type, subunit III
MNCSGCHGEHAGGGMGPSLRDVDWLYGGADAQVFDSIAHGRANGMPSWGTKLDQDQIGSSWRASRPYERAKRDFATELTETSTLVRRTSRRCRTEVTNRANRANGG